MNLDEIRKQYPQYDVLSDGELASALHEKFYSQLDFKDFSKRIGYTKGANPGEYDHSSEEYKAKFGATSGMSGVDKFRAGGGKGFIDLARGAGQFIGATSRQDVQDSRERDAALMETGAGKAGFVGANMAAALPAAAIPGANTLTGAALVGAGLGALQPSTSTRETLGNTAFGAVTSPAAILGGRSIAAAYRGTKGLIEPFTQGGQERIAARTLTAFAGGKSAAQQASQNIDSAGAMLSGVKPTTAELAQNAGLSQLERTLKNNPEYMQEFADRATANKGAVMSALDDLAGDSVKMRAAEGARTSASKPLYDAADKSVVVPSNTAMVKLFERPSMTKAWDRAASLAAEAGEDFPKSAETVSTMNGRQLHYLKMAMDDLADTPERFGIGANEARAIGSTRNAFLNEIETAIPKYKDARETFAAMSKPINQMEIGGALRDKFQPALADFGATARTRPQAFAQALREGDAVAAKALGRSQANIDDVMTRQQMDVLNKIGEQLGRRANADDLGRAVGSNTGQNIVSQNVLRQFLGPFGLPESSMQRAAESTLLQSMMRPVGFAGKLGEDRVLKKLVEAGLEPKQAKRLLDIGLTQDQIAGFLKYQSALGASASSGANAARQ